MVHVPLALVSAFGGFAASAVLVIAVCVAMLGRSSFVGRELATTEQQ